MCGIAGAVWTAGSLLVTEPVLRRMTQSLAHRGPDDDGHYFATVGKTTVALGHRRLSIIDLSTGKQPIANEDQMVWVVFNGEIYNYRELREELLAKGHQFRTDTDTEVLVHLYEEMGEDCVDRLRGMFAFAIWDAAGERLFLARDRIGQKPLFYHCSNGRLIFASELKALLQVPGVTKSVDPTAIDDFLTYQYVPHAKSILNGFHKLPPAHSAIFSKGELSVRRYWQPPYSEISSNSVFSDSDPADELRQLVTESVQLRMRSDVPVGAFLSGGVDSTIIAGVMQQLATQQIHTFSIGFDEPRFDERTFARQAAEHLKTNHHEFVVRPDVLEMMAKLSWHYDEPFADSSAIPTMYLSKVTRDIVKVSLSGDGGDELFAGYDRYRAVQLAARFDKLPPWIKNGISSPLVQKLPSSVQQKSTLRRLKRFLQELREDPARRYANWISIFRREMLNQLYTDDFKEQIAAHDAFQFLDEAYRECEERDFVTRTTSADVLTYLPCDILTKVDIASMAYGLECRSPFLDHRVVEFAARLPIEEKRRGRDGKIVLKNAFRELLPEEIHSRSKMGFGVPLDHWFRGELKEFLIDTLTSQAFNDRGYFQPRAVQEMIDEHLQEKVDHSSRLWALVVLEFWHTNFFDRDIASADFVLP